MKFDSRTNWERFDVVNGKLSFGGATVLYGITVSVSSVEGKAECFEGGAEFVVGKSGFEVVAGVFGGTVGYGFRKFMSWLVRVSNWQQFLSASMRG